MKILIIGGSRFVGPLVIDLFVKGGHEVTVFNRGNLRLDYPKGVEFVKGDRDNGFNIKNRFDIVIDMCAYNGSQIVKAIEGLDSEHFVYVSSVAAYKKTNSFPISESSRTGDWPLWGDYNKGKVECEEVLKQSGISHSVIRPVYILGRNNHLERERFIYSKIRKSEPIIVPGNGQAVVQFVFAQDVAESILLLVEKRCKGSFNCAGDSLVTLTGLINMMADLVGKKPKIHFNPDADGDRFNSKEFPFANENVICCNDKLKSLGIRFTPLAEGLRDDYEGYFKKNE